MRAVGMTRPARVCAGALAALLATVLVMAPLAAQPPASLPPPDAVQAAQPLLIGYVELDDDPRYDQDHMDLRLPRQPLGRPFAAAEVALKEGRFAFARAGVAATLERVTLPDAAALPTALDELRTAGARFILLDLPDAQVTAAAEHLSGAADTLLFNLTAPGNALRQGCRPGLLHVGPSQAMLDDALAQYLVSRKWLKLFLLTGPTPADAELRASFGQAAERYGLRIVEEKPFVHGRDPRQRAQNNIALLTSGPDHDLVVVLDALGELARDVPFHTQRPRPVAGSAGLVADAWHWSWERHGAPQLNRRVRKQSGHLMTGADWAAWAAVKAIHESVLRTGTGAPAEVAAYLQSDRLALDGFKGYALDFRPWSGQLRQPVFLTTGDNVVARAPISGFLHPVNNLDTLGMDATAAGCPEGGGG
jgi:ABC transporter substrate binding protein (PQQ-dependent alcohol dehydrogenase system)